MGARRVDVPKHDESYLMGIIDAEGAAIAAVRLAMPAGPARNTIINLVAATIDARRVFVLGSERSELVSSSKQPLGPASC
jgi:hypothetical protein